MYNDLTLIIAGIISLIVFVAILYIASYVSEIKRLLRKRDGAYWRSQAAKHFFFSNKKEELGALQEALWIELKEANNKIYLTKKQKVEKLKSIISRYEEKITELGGTIKSVEDLV